MMSESGTEEHPNGDSTFEIVDNNTSSPPTTATGPVPVSLPSPSHFPPPPTASSTPPSFQKKDPSSSPANPYSIKAGMTSAQPQTQRAPPPPPPPVATNVFHPPASGFESSGGAVGQGMAPSVGLDMGASPLSVGEETGGGVGGGSGVWGWIQGTVSGSHILTKVAETAKSSVDSVITTLDPQMKDYMASAGAVELAIASDKEIKINAVKEGFQRVYSQVIARGLGSPGSPTMAAQPFGFDNARKGAEERMRSLRNSGLVPRDVPIVAVEGFVFQTQDRMFGMDCVLLDDSTRNIQLEVLSQAIQIPPRAVHLLKSHTPADYPLGESGFAVTVGQAVAEATGSTPYDWQEHLCGISRRHIIASAASALAYQYTTSLQSFTTQQ